MDDTANLQTHSSMQHYTAKRVNNSLAMGLYEEEEEELQLNLVMRTPVQCGHL